MVSMDNHPIPVGSWANYTADMISNDFPSFLEALNRHLDEWSEDITTLALRAGVKRDALYKVKYGKTRTPSVEIAVKVAHAYGKSVEEFMGLSPAQVRDQLAEQIARMTPQEQAILEASLTAILSQRADDGQAAPQGAETTKPPADPKGD
ncbi:helix-turn-helix domain-containing protein [Donghicola eburneus]|uniref:helix-turn-helix domain-containing protein n=1 Tax=Donghicola eburneus TaxID=393278 RepID=UPI0008E7A875|nr:helix-turn-helix transcriptional regulator [Donghicola eburneus]SFQ52202.1 Helix-turn-helix [Donghicola eburneus]